MKGSEPLIISKYGSDYNRYATYRLSDCFAIFILQRRSIVCVSNKCSQSIYLPFWQYPPDSAAGDENYANTRTDSDKPEGRHQHLSKVKRSSADLNDFRDSRCTRSPVITERLRASKERSAVPHRWASSAVA
jgi:hypothetical protein